MEQNKQKPQHILKEFGNTRKNELLYSILEEIRENYSSKTLDFSDTTYTLDEKVYCINERIHKEINKIIISKHSDNYTDEIAKNIIITNYLIKAMEKELKNESNVNLIYSDEYTSEESFSKYFGVERIGIERLIELLEKHKQELTENISIQEIANNNKDNIIKAIKENKDIYKYICEIVDEALDFDFFIKDEEDYIESIKEEGPEDDEDFYNWSINYQKEIINHLKKLKAKKNTIVNSIANDIIDMELNNELDYLYDNEDTKEELYDFIIKKIKTIKQTPKLEEIMKYYGEIENSLYKSCNIIPYYDSTEYLVKKLLNPNYNINMDHTDEFPNIDNIDIDESFNEELTPSYLKPHSKSLKPRK